MMLILRYVFAVLMIAAGINHLVNPKFYSRFIPDFFSKKLANIAATVAEITTGLLLMFPSTVKMGGLSVFAMMIAFLPLHVWDLMKEKPAIGSKKIAVIRLLLQFVLIYYGWWLWQS